MGRSVRAVPPMTENVIANRFRGFLPVIVDVETGGFNPRTDALLEIAAVTLEVDADVGWRRQATFAFHVRPFPGANLEQKARDCSEVVGE